LPPAHAEEWRVRGGGGKKAENFSDLRVWVRAPALLWFECGRKKGRKSAGKSRGKVKKSR